MSSQSQSGNFTNSHSAESHDTVSKWVRQETSQSPSPLQPLSPSQSQSQSNGPASRMMPRPGDRLHASSSASSTERSDTAPLARIDSDDEQRITHSNIHRRRGDVSGSGVRSKSSLSLERSGSGLTASILDAALSSQIRRRDSSAITSLRIDAHQKSRANTQAVKQIEEREQRVVNRVNLLNALLSGSGSKKRREREREREKEKDTSTLASTVVSFSEARDEDKYNASLSMLDSDNETQTQNRSLLRGNTAPNFMSSPPPSHSPSHGQHQGQGGNSGRKGGISEVRNWIEDKRESSRRAVIQHSAIEAAESKARSQAKSHAAQLRRMEFRLKAAEEEVNLARKSETDARAKAMNEKDKCIAAERVSSLLRSRLRQMSAKRMDTERKLLVFERFMPLFEVLSSRYDYSVTPESLISRLEVLERAQVELLSDLMNSQEKVAALEREAVSKEREWENERQKLSTEYTRSQEKIERKGDTLEATVRGTEDEIKSLQAKVERSARLEGALFDLWNAVKPVEWQEYENVARLAMEREIDMNMNTDADGVDDEIEALGYDKDEVMKMKRDMEALLPGVGGDNSNIEHPEQIVSALTLILTMRHSDRREAALRKLSGLSHRVWLKWYTDAYPELKSRPFATFEQLLTDHADALKTITALQTKIEESQKEKLDILDSLPINSPLRRGRIPLRSAQKKKRADSEQREECDDEVARVNIHMSSTPSSGKGKESGSKTPTRTSTSTSSSTATPAKSVSASRSTRRREIVGSKSVVGRGNGKGLSGGISIDRRRFGPRSGHDVRRADTHLGFV